MRGARGVHGERTLIPLVPKKPGFWCFRKLNSGSGAGSDSRGSSALVASSGARATATAARTVATAVAAGAAGGAGCDCSAPRTLAVPVHVHFAEHGELGRKTLRRKRLHLLIGAGLLATKLPRSRGPSALPSDAARPVRPEHLIAGERAHHEAALAVRLVQVLEAHVLRREAALRRHWRERAVRILIAQLHSATGTPLTMSATLPSHTSRMVSSLPSMSTTLKS